MPNDSKISEVETIMKKFDSTYQIRQAMVSIKDSLEKENFSQIDNMDSYDGNFVKISMLQKKFDSKVLDYLIPVLIANFDHNGSKMIQRDEFKSLLKNKSLTENDLFDKILGLIREKDIQKVFLGTDLKSGDPNLLKRRDY